ncbi:molybdate ABC transporter substrate-binding protein [Halovulum dunhuangense]|uniref:Molybdate ABC transporter substrate-binding protein n=1 Tax=Halovulum dunhuangense TaxID=1505036 RepID=A0A849KQT6_9RHOB|nr:molybdate ABC transporter substrate-binding protein [Halovulum dunhuangense]NNU79433.1 molybdate ABC transporter substrate-binding protein [Halovulum dunhuangense]
MHARLAALALCATTAMPAAAGDVTVFAAASLRTALDGIAAGWKAETGHAVTLSYAGSSALARQIEQGAPADIFISSSVDWMDLLETEALLAPGTRRDLLGNTLVLVAHGPDAAPVGIGPALDLPALLGPEGRLAMALVDAVPAGVYGRQALESLGLWERVAPQVAQSDNVRTALALVASGEAPLGIVYGSDAVAEPGVSVIGTFPEDSHAPIVYPVAQTADSDSAAAAEFLAHLGSPAAAASFARQGFIVLE